MATPQPTQTSYAVLGLLSLRPWTAYELARQSERSLSWFFPRAERAVYLEAKRLVVLGWARSEPTMTGRRPGSRYRITQAGRRALRDWLEQPSAPAQVESEAALKVFFADQHDLETLRATIHEIRAQACHSLSRLAAMAAEGRAGDAAFPDRLNTNVLSMKLVSDLHDTLRTWADWADGAVDVLGSGDAGALAQQTDALLRTIERKGAGTVSP